MYDGRKITSRKRPLEEDTPVGAASREACAVRLIFGWLFSMEDVRVWVLGSDAAPGMALACMQATRVLI